MKKSHTKHTVFNKKLTREWVERYIFHVTSTKKLISIIGFYVSYVIYTIIWDHILNMNIDQVKI